jgi:23S rRNA (pseudouridine1915-N3)-methyltransferase
MRVTIAAVGRQKRGPERDISERLLSRTMATARKFGITFVLREIPESRATTAKLRIDQEATAILAALPDKAVLVALDERGQTLDSRAFALRLSAWRDNGLSDVVFAIGGADGHGPALVERSDLRLAFGAMTWPHQLARVMLFEQLYRAITIWSGHPYHRD